jgi:electron transfer flavoprotein beta subunit
VASLGKFVVLAGYKTTDGETGSVGPQVAEALTDLFGFMVPHVAYVDDFELESATAPIVAQRRIGRYVQSLRCPLPALLTIAPEYRPRVAPAGRKKEARAHNYRGKRHEAYRWDIEFLGADPGKVGLPGSPTLVGPGVDIGGPPAQKYVGKTMIFTKPVGEFELEGKKQGPFKPGDIVMGLPQRIIDQLASQGAVQTFSYEHLVRELFGGLNGAARSP